MEGAFTALKHFLPSIETKNAKSAYQHGLILTDAIGHWVKNRMVAGPFDKPPFENFRSNPLMAVQQKTKVRPILNLSAQKILLFNDVVPVNDHRIRKLIMSSDALFAKALKRARKGALMAKYDICDAYKQILGHPSQRAAFGFRWLGKYFYDLTTVFGSKSAPANLDFDSVTMSWKLPVSRVTGILSIIDHFLIAKTCNLKEVQRLQRKLLDFVQMSKFMTGFSFQLSKLSGSFES